MNEQSKQVIQAALPEKQPNQVFFENQKQFKNWLHGTTSWYAIMVSTGWIKPFDPLLNLD